MWSCFSRKKNIGNSPIYHERVLMFPLRKDRNQNMCFREAMTAIRKPWPGLSGMLNAIHPQGYLWRQNPFGICLCFIFLNACIKSAEWKKMKVTPSTSQMLALRACCLVVEGCTPCCVHNEWLQFGRSASQCGPFVQCVVLSVDWD